MTPDQTTQTSKFLSLILRHKPEVANIELDDSGWTDVRALLIACAKIGRQISRANLDHLVATNPKKRFEFNSDRTRIRASQGHSIEVDLKYPRREPPELLYHGTATRFIESIRKQGLMRMERHHVHLSAETQMTMEVGARRGKPVLLIIRALEMHQAGFSFSQTTNGVWIVDQVPAQYIEFPQ